MIDLTPLEVRKKKGDFRRLMRGYDPAQVDDFLDLVADRLEQVVRESLANAERANVLNRQVSDFRDRERALTEALVTAQEMREEIRKQGLKEAELARREAEQAAEHIRSTAVLVRQSEEEAIRRLRARQMQLLQSYRSFLERELTELNVMAETLETNRSRPIIPDAPGSDQQNNVAAGSEPRNTSDEKPVELSDESAVIDAWVSTVIEKRA
jgi:DivIVA domain-containing protein